ncbi:hypothetical protein RF55_9408 [Lasius niger]|uniref:Uncharacterized protein n=1 Tax=Lasius niger TaxID=67767 RepID=A0A0J7KKN8_LASNI|nr:hypothetical protein RF55_9408 [Lasius niger]
MSEEGRGGTMKGVEGRKIGGEESKKKVGRPKKIEELSKERRGSTGCLEDYLKRKREGPEEEDKEVEEWALRRSKMLERLQEGGMVMDKEELGAMIREMGDKLRDRLCEELEKMRLESWQREKEWNEEREKMGDKIKNLEERIMVMEAKLERGIEEGGGTGESGKREFRWLDKTTADGMKNIRRKLEMKEREEKRNNILIRRLEGGTGEIKERVKKVFEGIGAKVEIEWVRKLRGREGREGDMVVVRLGSRDQKRQVMEKKKELRGKATRIEDDLTWEERKMKWKIGEIANEERKRGNRVWTAYGRIRINECWWKWDEEEGKLKNWRGEMREDNEEMGEEMRG